MMLEHAKSNPLNDLFKLGIFAGASLPFDLDNNTGIGQWLSANSKNPTKESPHFEGEFDGELGEDEPPGFPTAPWLATGEPLLGRYHPEKNPGTRIKVPTLHMIGERDQYAGQSQVLARMCAGDSTVIRHREGHSIPRDRQFQNKAIAGMERIIQKVQFRS